MDAAVDAAAPDLVGALADRSVAARRPGERVAPDLERRLAFAEKVLEHRAARAGERAMAGRIFRVRRGFEQRLPCRIGFRLSMEARFPGWKAGSAFAR